MHCYSKKIQRYFLLYAHSSFKIKSKNSLKIVFIVYHLLINYLNSFFLFLQGVSRVKEMFERSPASENKPVYGRHQQRSKNDYDNVNVYKYQNSKRPASALQRNNRYNVNEQRPMSSINDRSPYSDDYIYSNQEKNTRNNLFYRRSPSPKSRNYVEQDRMASADMYHPKRDRGNPDRPIEVTYNRRQYRNPINENRPSSTAHEKRHHMRPPSTPPERRGEPNMRYRNFGQRPQSSDPMGRISSADLHQQPADYRTHIHRDYEDFGDKQPYRGDRRNDDFMRQNNFSYDGHNNYGNLFFNIINL